MTLSAVSTIDQLPGDEWPSNRGRMTYRKEQLAERELEPCTTRCAYCNQVFSGTLESGRSWFRNHPCPSSPQGGPVV